MKVLVACEESQTVCIAFRAKGHEAYSCDIQEPSGGHPEWHILGDVLPLLNGRCEFKTMDGTVHRIDGRWDLIIAHPPCTYLSNAGARWLYAGGHLNAERFKLGMEAKEFFMKFLNADCERIAVENPKPSKIFELPKPSLKIQPYEHGEPYTKLTFLWTRGLAPIVPTKIVIPQGPYCPSHTSRKKKEKYGVAEHDAKSRAKTFPGIALAMAEQWGCLEV